MFGGFIMKKSILKRNENRPADVNVVYSSLANYYTGPVTAGGNLILTDDELVFDGHFFNVGRTKASISIKDISDVQITKKILNFQHLFITANDETHKFSVDHGDELVKHIEKARSEQKTHVI